MQMTTRLLALLIALLTTTAGAALGSTSEDSDDSGDSETEPVEDDADSGKDAGDSKSASLRLQSAGRYTAHLTDLDHDWYVHGSGSATAACVQTSAAGDRLTHSVFQSRSSSGDRLITVHGGSVTFGFAATGLEDLYFGFSTDGTTDGGNRYDFATSVLPLSHVTSDPGGTDASGTLLGATPAPEGCFGGTLSPEAGDSIDTYTFKGTAGDSVVFTFAHGSGAELELSLVRPDGSIVGSTGADGSVSATLDTSGDWFLVVKETSGFSSVSPQGTMPLSETRSWTGGTYADSDLDYEIGGCRPMCYE